MDRIESEVDPVPPVLACIAYSMYKNEKRRFITDWTEENGSIPLPPDVANYVKGWNDLRIESTFAAARLELDLYVEAVVEAAKDELREEVYQSLFKGISDQIATHNGASESRITNLRSLIKERTKSNWLLSGVADVFIAMIANTLWFVLTIAIILGTYANFDLGTFAEKTKALFDQKAPTSSSTK